MLAQFEHGSFCLALATLYSPVNSRDPKVQRTTERLYNWLKQARQMLPRRCKFVLGLDANGRVGANREYEYPVDEAEVQEERDREYLPIGPEGAKEENEMGTLFRRYLEAERLTALNTWVAGASGHTWRNGSNQSRVDYIVTCETAVRGRNAVQQLDVRRNEALAKEMRYAFNKELNDHIPLVWRCNDVKWEQGPRQEQNYDAHAGMKGRNSTCTRSTRRPRNCGRN